MPKYNGFKAKCTGFSHIKSNTGCQDAVGYYCSEEVAICVVSDGHGSDKYFRSDVGSGIAVEVAIEAVKEFIDRQNTYIGEQEKNGSPRHILSSTNYTKLFNDLVGYIVSQWIDRIETHWKTNPCSDSEKPLYDKHFTDSSIEAGFTKIYGATLIIGVIAKNSGFIIQIGDGAACIIKQNGHRLVPKGLIDEDQYGGRTNSLSSSNCLSRFRFYYAKTIPKAIIVASDGVVDSYGRNDGKDYLSFCAKLADLYSDNYEQAQGLLDDWLPQLSEKGSQDDMSVAGVFLSPKTNEPDASSVLEGNNEEHDQAGIAKT